MSFACFEVALDDRPVRPSHPARKGRRPVKDKALRAIRPNAGIEAAYRKKLLALVDEMNASILWWVRAQYRKTPPALAQDELSANALKAEMRRLAARWTAKFDRMAEELAKYFAISVGQRTDGALKRILKEGGFAVDFRMTRAQRDVLNAVVSENVALIKSIPRDHLAKVEGVVMRSVQTGRDVGGLVKDLQHQFGVTKRRAQFIALDQNSKATAMLSRARSLECGITEAVWVHSHAGKHPRPSHVKAGADKAVFSIKEGWPDPALGGKRIWPGTEPRCRCVCRTVLPGRNLLNRT